MPRRTAGARAWDRPAEPGAPVSPPSPAEQAPPPGAPAPQPRPYPQEPPATPNARTRAGAPPTPAPPPPAPERRRRPAAADKQTLAQRIADEKQLRQSTDQQIQILALQFQATRCNDEDVLAGNDDPNLPLVTCSQDGKQVYLLDKAIIKGEQIKNADSGLDQQRGEYVVDPGVQR